MTDSEIRYTTPVTADDLTEEMREAAREIVQGWYGTGSIDWEDVWDRMDGMTLVDGSTLDLSDSLVSAALSALKADIRKERKSW